jgi:hypothetical protein
MKKLISIISLLTLCASLLACGGAGGGTTPAGTTTAPAPGGAGEYFVFEELEDIGTGEIYYAVVGLTDAGKQQTELTVPATHNGKTVEEISSEAFKGATRLEKLTVNDNIICIGDGIFDGASAMRELVVNGAADDILISTVNDELPILEQGLLKGAPASIRIYVPAAELDSFSQNYFWGNYGAFLEAIGA